MADLKEKLTAGEDHATLGGIDEGKKVAADTELKGSIPTIMNDGKSKGYTIMTQDQETALDRKSQNYLLVVLGVNLLVCFGINYVFDFPQALEDPLLRLFRIDTVKLELLYSMYAIPNVLLCPFSGYLIEKIGSQKAGLVFAFLVLVGQILCINGIRTERFDWMIAGRGIYGVGAEGMLILQATINEFWFSGRFLSVSNALCQLVNNFALLSGNFATPIVFENSRSLEKPLYIGGVVCLVSLVVSLTYYFLYKAYSPRRKEEQKEDDIDDELRNSDLFVLMQQDPSFKISFGFSSIKFFNTTFWLLCVVYLLLANATLQFTNIATEMITNRYTYEYEDAKYFTVMPQVSFILLSPIISKVIEAKGRKALALLIASVVLLLNYFALHYMPVAKSNFLYLNMILIGFSNAVLLSTIYSSVALTIPRQGVSMAYSILALVENLGISTLPLYFGWILKQRRIEDFNDALLNLQLIALLAVLASLVLLLHDVRQSRVLELPENSQRVASIRSQINSDFIRKSFHESMKNSKRGSRRGSAGEDDEIFKSLKDPERENSNRSHSVSGSKKKAEVE